MQVTFKYVESTGEYNVDAEVNGSRVFIVAVTDEYNEDIDIDDFSDDEQYTMRGIALREYHNIMNADDDEADEQGEEKEEWA
jgi:hypothetical protein